MTTTVPTDWDRERAAKIWEDIYHDNAGLRVVAWILSGLTHVIEEKDLAAADLPMWVIEHTWVWAEVAEGDWETQQNDGLWCLFAAQTVSAMARDLLAQRTEAKAARAAFEAAS